MTSRQIDDVDVVTHPGAVHRVVVIAEDLQPIASPNGNLGDERQQVVGDTVWVFTDGAAWMCARRVEVAEQPEAPLGVRCGNVVQDLLEEPFGAPIRVGRAERCALDERHRVVGAVHRGAGGEHQRVAPVGLHHLEQHQRSCDVVRVVPQRDVCALPNGFQACEMDDSVGPQRREDIGQGVAIGDVDHVQRSLAACDGVDPSNRFSLRVVQVVDDRNLMTPAEQLDHGMASDVTGSTGDEDSHDLSSTIGRVRDR